MYGRLAGSLQHIWLVIQRLKPSIRLPFGPADGKAGGPASKGIRAGRRFDRQRTISCRQGAVAYECKKHNTTVYYFNSTASFKQHIIAIS